MADSERYGNAEQYADDTATAGQDDGLDEELDDNVESFGSESAAYADLAGALCDSSEHDVHNADSTDEQGDCGDGSKHNVEDLFGTFGLP